MIDHLDDDIPDIDNDDIMGKVNSKRVIDRMTKHKDQKRFIIYPENKRKSWWDFFITIILLVTCLLTPWQLAFYAVEDSMVLSVINDCIDLLFLIDIIVIFNTAFYDEDLDLIDDRK